MQLPDTFVPFQLGEIEDTLTGRFERQAKLHARRTALEVDRHPFTYEELNLRANRIAHSILDRAGDESEPVALLLGQNATLVAAILGVLKSGRPYIPLSASWPTSVLRELLADSGARTILADDSASAIARTLATRRCPVLDVERLSTSGNTTNPGVSRSPRDTAYVYYTSGSTGQPKGVSDTHRNVLHNIYRYTNSLGICAEDRLTLLQGSAFSGAVSSLFGALLNGACVLPLDASRQTAAALAQTLARTRVTMYHSVPALFRSIVAEAPRLDGLRVVRLEGDRASHEDMRLLHRHLGEQCTLVNGLGITETGLIRQFFVDHRMEVAPGILPVGYPVSDMDVYLCDASGRRVTPGDVGEITVRSEFLSPGYWRRPDLTSAAFAVDPAHDGRRVYRTGDLGRMRADGCLDYLGRCDSRVKIRGQTVDMADVEAALLRLPSIRDAAVVASPAAEGESRLVGYVVHAGTPLRADTIRRELARHVPSHMIPARFVELEALPLTSNRKLDRAALPPLATGRPRLETEFLSPTSMLEALLVEIWEEFLDVRPIGIDDDFASLGGDSLLALRMAAHIEQRLGRNLSLSVLLGASTVAEMARAVVEREPIDLRAPVVCLNSGGTRPPFVFLHGDYLSDGFPYLQLARYLPPDQPVFLLPPCGLDGSAIPPTFEDMARQHLVALREVQPVGPYRLGGHCNGGLVAFAMARLLEQAGEEVELLVLSRAYGNGIRFKRHDLLASVLATALAEGSSGRIAWQLRLRNLSDAWRRASAAERATLVLRKVRAVPRRLLRRPRAPIEVRTTATPSRTDRLQRLRELYWRCERLYVPGPYLGRITLLWPEIDEQTPAEAASWWSRISRDVDVKVLRGDHITCWTAHVEDTARQLASLLEQNRRPPGCPLEV